MCVALPSTATTATTTAREGFTLPNPPGKVERATRATGAEGGMMRATNANWDQSQNTRRARVCIEIHGDGPEAINAMLADLSASPPEDWDRLTAHFEEQLLDAPPIDPGTTRVHFRDFALDDGRRVAFDADVPLDRLDALRAAGHDVELVSEPQPANAAVRCADCGHSDLDGGIAHCGAGVDSGLAVGGFWYSDTHQCDRFTAQTEE